MRIIKKVEVTKEELGAIEKVSKLDCSCMHNCDECPLLLPYETSCIKSLAINTLAKLVAKEE